MLLRSGRTAATLLTTLQPHFFRRPALGIKAIPAHQRTAVKGRQSGHALTVSGEPVTRYTDKRQKTICIHTEKPDAIRRTLSISKSNILHTDTQIKGIKKR